MHPRPLSDDSKYDWRELNRQLDRVKTAAFLGSSAAFLGPLMSGMEFIWTEDVETAATDGIHIWWNPKDFLALDFEMQKSTLIHELWHPGNLHFIRQGDRDPDSWNIAGDIDINNNLKKDKYKVEKPFFIWDMAHDGKSVEEIYEIIHKNRQCAPWGPGSAQGDPSTGNGQGQPKPGGANGKDMIPALSPQDTQKAVNNVIQAAYTAMAAGEPGAVPGAVKDHITKFLRPKLPWHRILLNWCIEKVVSDYTWRRPNRRYLPDHYLPTLDGDDRLIDMLFCGDVSGSVTDDQFTRIISEVKGIKEKLNPKKLTFLQFDTRITRVDTWDENEPMDVVPLVGRGGTCLKEVRQYILKHKPQVVVIFSDLYVVPMEPVPVPVIWIAVDNKAARVKCGKIIHINS